MRFHIAGPSARIKIRGPLKRLWLLLTPAVLALTPLDASPQETSTAEIIKQLQKKVEELEDKVRALEQSQSAAQAGPRTNKAVEELGPAQEVPRPEDTRQAVAGPARALPSVSLGLNGLIVRSEDTNFLLNVHGYAQADGRFYFNEHNPASDTFLLRRVRPIVEGTVYQRFDYRMMADFGSGNGNGSSAGNNALLDDAYVNARVFPGLQLQVGKYKSPVGLERLESAAELLFIENGFATQLTPNYDVGVEVHNNLFNAPVNYALGVFNGAADAASMDADTTDEGKDVVGRLFLQPFLRSDNEALNKLGFGVGGSVGHHEGPLPAYKTPGQQTFFSYAPTVSAKGEQYRIDPQFFYYWGPFGVLAEYIISSQEVIATTKNSSARFNNSAWQVEASYFLTGDNNSFRSTSRNLFQPAHPFNFGGGGWGAFEVVARIQQLSLDRAAFPNWVSSSSAREATAWGVGLNWYLNSAIRFYLDFESTHFDGGSKATTALTARDERVVLGRVQFSF